MLKYLLSILILLAAIPVGLLLAKLTKDEKLIYKKYFPSFLWILAILSAIFYTLNIKIALALTFMFIVMFVWNKKGNKK